MRTALLLAALLVVGAVAAPAASAEHVVCNRDTDLPEKVCAAAESHGYEIVLCFINEAPKDWLDECP